MGPRANSYIRAEQRRFRRARAGQSWSVKDLPQFYYHKNFCVFLDSVISIHNSVLGQSELAFARDFKSLPHAAQCIYARMVGRKGRVFDTDKFDYPEIDDLPGALATLRSHGFARSVCRESFADYLACIPKAELVLLLCDHVCDTQFKKSWAKAKLITAALDHMDGDDLIFPARYVVQGHTTALNYLFYLHFGKIEYSLKDVTLRDLGLIKMPKSDGVQTCPHEHLDAARAAYFYARNLDDLKAGSDAEFDHLIQTVNDWPRPHCARSETHRDKLMQRLGGLCERRNDIDAALDLYGRVDSALCNERVVRLSYKRGETDWVRERLESMIENPASDDEHVFASDFYARKFKKKRTSAVTDILRNAETLKLDEAFRNQPERSALWHYKEQGIEGFLAENVPWRNLFGLLFWDELYRAEGVSLRLPSALQEGSFYARHKASIEAKLAGLNDHGKTMLSLLKSLSANYGVANGIVYWGHKSLDRLKALVTHAPPGALATILRGMAQDWTAMKDGFPDLMLIENDALRFIEIKAEGDVIRRNQLTRIRQLNAAGFPSEIMRVEWRVDPDQIYVVVDVETTGGRPGLHRVTEIGAVKMQAGEIIGEWSSLINPQRAIPPNITNITGITNQMVADAPIFANIADSFEAFMGNAIFAAHNVNFDYGFISTEFQMIDRRFRFPKICTCASMRKLYPGYRSYSLKNLCREFEISLESHHRALCDAKAAAELLNLVNARRIDG